MAAYRMKLLLSLRRCSLGMSSSPLFQARKFCSSSLPSSKIERIGFIGLGNMGSRMANNLIKAGYSVAVHDINDDIMKAFSKRGVLVKNSPLEVAEESDAVITMLPSSAHVMDVYTGPKGILNHGDQLQSWLFIDSSTIDPQTSRKVSAAVSTSSLKGNKGGCSTPAMLDAPVSGGIISAENGTLTFMVGGSEEAYKSARPLFLSMGKNIIYCGGSGNGSTAKICNNLAMAVSMLGVSEAFALGQSLGIGASTLTEIFNSSSARCWSSDTYNPVPGVMGGVPSSRDYNGGFSTKLMAKDLTLAAASAKEVGSRSPMTFLAQKIFSELCDGGRIIWLGDLNYRVNLPYELTRELISKKDWCKLVERDQLSKELRKGRAFDGWSEGSLNFAPTYKYEFNSDSYCGEDPKAGRRTPAWCDRILSYGTGMKLLDYRRSELKLSDHRPVTATYMVEVEVFSPRKLQRALTFTDAEVEQHNLVTEMGLGGGVGQLELGEDGTYWER